MPELIALTKLSVTRNATVLKMAVTYFVLLHLSICLVGFSGTVDSTSLAQMVAPLAIIFSMPLVGITFALFDFGEHSEIVTAASGYSPWLLRAPVKTWKLAAVPLSLKSLWILMVCGGIALTAHMLGAPLERWFVPAVGIASLFTLACLISWHPYRSDYGRLATIGLLGLPAYGWLIHCAAFAFAKRGWDLPPGRTAIVGISLLTIGIYVALTLLALRAIRLARANVNGRIKETPGRFLSEDDSHALRTSSARAQAGYKQSAAVFPVGALLGLDRARLSGWGARIVVAAWLLIVLFWSILDSAGIDAIIATIFLLLMPAMFLCEWMLSSVDRKFLPSVIAVAPISSATIAWTRQGIVTAIWLASLLGLPMILAAWRISGASNTMNDRWNQTFANQLGTPDAGWRIAAAMSLVGLLVVVRQTTWSAAAGATGQPRLTVWSIAAKIAVAWVVFSWFLYQFLQFPDWEAWSQWAWRQIASLPKILPWLFTAKLTIIAVATALLRRSGLVKHRTVVGLVIALALITVLCSTAVWVLIPSEQVLLWHCIAAVATIMPASRILLAPICLQHNRHR